MSIVFVPRSNYWQGQMVPTRYSLVSFWGASGQAMPAPSKAPPECKTSCGPLSVSYCSGELWSPNKLGEGSAPQGYLGC